MFVLLLVSVKSLSPERKWRIGSKLMEEVQEVLYVDDREGLLPNSTYKYH